MSSRDAILIVNAGSSSVKFQVFGIGTAGEPVRLIKGQVDGIGTRPRLRASDSDGAVLIDRMSTVADIPDVPAALHAAGDWLRQQHGINPVAVGHRVVHGGPEYDKAVLIDADVIARLEKYVPLAPLHQPNNLAPIRTIGERFPGLAQVACFDTAFHRAHDALADHFALPEHLHDEGVRRYGFHGLSYEFIASRLPAVAPDIATGRVIVAHLGSGASMCALSNGRSIESTMGFTALDGLPMGTRPGHLDPGVILYLIGQQGMSVAGVQEMLYHDCGLKGLSGISNDVRELEASTDPRAQFALEYFAYRISLCAGMLCAALGGLDAFVFTAGIGENSAGVRARTVARLKWLGVELDSAANASHALRISRPESRCPVYVIPTDEELMIARHTMTLIADRDVSDPALARS
ncbi:acetate/propionate family kinase [Vineibacter terrae]|uniref:Acetate kinase n=1 Tax=Vineibacter terrae TaxID=2586908 RepID=A0A5C8PP70_9HYPH|nr:acetate/propionate family kinase [Vineibacter terrae]TXL75652.1 acetate/propionate family kinase [Vineibacter terrae]